MNNFFPKTDNILFDAKIHRNWSRNDTKPDSNAFSNSFPATRNLVSPHKSSCFANPLPQTAVGN